MAGERPRGLKASRLMIPGPVDVDPSVLAQMALPQIAHYSEEAVASYHRCAEALRVVLGCHHGQDVFIMNGSGNVAVDAAAASIIRGGDTVFVATNGFFGQRMAFIARSYGARVVEPDVQPGRAVKVQDVQATLRRHPKVSAIFMVHLETSTGVLNPIAEVGELTRREGLPLIVDAVSSAAVDPFEMEAWNVSVCATSSQKGLETPPGLGIAVVSEQGWKFIDERAVKDHGWYANLSYWREKAATRYVGEATVHPCLATMAVNNVQALEMSLRRIIAEGMPERIRRHARIAEALRVGLQALGFAVFPEPGFRSSAVTVVSNTLGIDVNELIAWLKSSYSIEISNGIGELSNKIMRIGHIGQNAARDCIVPLLFGIEQFLRRKGLRLPVGASLTGVDSMADQ